MRYKKEQYHGLSKTRIYSIWAGMKERCYNKNHKKYKHYGGKGIKVCSLWLNSVAVFVNYSYSVGYADDLIMDRINNDGDYEPGNIRFTTYKTNNRNKCNNTILTINGISRPMSEWAELYNIKNSTFKSRYYKGQRGEELLKTAQLGHSQSEETKLKISISLLCNKRAAKKKGDNIGIFK